MLSPYNILLSLQFILHAAVSHVLKTCLNYITFLLKICSWAIFEGVRTKMLIVACTSEVSQLFLCSFPTPKRGWLFNTLPFIAFICAIPSAWPASSYFLSYTTHMTAFTLILWNSAYILLPQKILTHIRIQNLRIYVISVPLLLQCRIMALVTKSLILWFISFNLMQK